MIVAVINFVSICGAVAKNYSLYRGSKSNFADEKCYIISAVFKI